MITGFLLAYACFTLPIFVWALWRAFKRAKPAREEGKMTAEQLFNIEELFKKHGLEAKVHEIPKTPTEAIIVWSQIVLGAIKEVRQEIVPWFTLLRDKVDDNKRDSIAIMQATAKIASAMLDIKNIAEKVNEPKDNPGSAESFIHSLEYARDKFAKTAPQRKAVEAIITNIRTSHESSK